MIFKFFPLLVITGLGGAVIFNRNLIGNSEETVMNEMSRGYKEVEKEWGNQEGERRLSFWRKGINGEGLKRNREGREEIYKDIFIFDLCNKWIKFAGEGKNENHDQANEKQDYSAGYGYNWQDICQIVKNPENNIGWFEFLTKVMKANGLVKVEECCKTEEKICLNEKDWNGGEWLKKCFDFEWEKEKRNSREKTNKKICKGISIGNGREDNQLVSNSETNCIDETIIEKISKRIKISRNGFGDSQEQNYWCNEDKNGYKDKGQEGKINEQCQKILKEKIQDFVKKNSVNSQENISQKDNKDNLVCQEKYSGNKVEIRCSDGWFLSSAKSNV